VQIGPFYTNVCKRCSEPVWNAMGLVDFFMKLRKR
jgi:hypothetical protein